MALLIRIDKIVNFLLGGSIKETLSSRAYRMDVKGQPVWGWTREFIDWLFFLEDNHCENAHKAFLNGK